jgi:ABC-type branched-subunit amino acid transport system substrate-binding protein
VQLKFCEVHFDSYIRVNSTAFIIKAGETLKADALQQLIAKEHPAVILLWTGPEALRALATMAATSIRPEVLFVSAGQLKENLWNMPENVREFTYITYPYRLAQDEKKYEIFVEPLLKSKKIQNPERRITARTYSLVRVMTQALMHMRRNFYRDNFLDVISMLPDLVYPVYERLSFGPGQRYASKGCYIVQLSKGSKSELIKKGDWVIH